MLYLQLSKYINKIEKPVIILILLYSGGAWLFRPPYFITTHGGELTSEYGIGKFSSLINLAIYAITFLLVAVKWKHFLYTLTKEKLLLFAMCLVVCSVLWSVSPESTMAYNKGLLRVTALGIYLALRYSLKEQLNILAWTFGIAAVTSLIYCLIFPNLGIQPDRYGETAGWRGIFFHKNHFGRQMAFSSSIFLLLALKQVEDRMLHWMLCAVSFSLLILSNSKTALLCFILAAFLFPIAALFKHSIKIILFVFPLVMIFLTGLIVTILLRVGVVLNAMNKDTTLTGRIPVWNFLLEKLSEKPLLGYGHNAFWKTLSNDTGYLYSFNWKVGHAHNGFLEVALSVGIIGLLLFLLSFTIAYIRAISLIRFANTAENFWPLQFLTITLITNLAVGSTFFDPSSYWMIYIAIIFSLALKQDRLRRIVSTESTENIGNIYVNSVSVKYDTRSENSNTYYLL